MAIFNLRSWIVKSVFDCPLPGVTNVQFLMESLFIPLSDINECDEQISGCSQVCTNNPGSFNCSCYQGYTYDSGTNTCTQGRQGVWNENYFSYFSTEEYVVCTQKNRLNEITLLSTQNTLCIQGKPLKKYYCKQ